MAAKADDPNTTKDEIWLNEALMLAAVPLGLSLAKEMLVHWIATGQLPLSFMLWKKRDGDGLARWVQRRHDLEGWGHVFPDSIMPPPEYSPGDLRFWSASPKIDWENNEARENATWGVRALGIKVSREHLLALLTATPRGAPAEPDEPSPGSSASAETPTSPEASASPPQAAAEPIAEPVSPELMAAIRGGTLKRKADEATPASSEAPAQLSSPAPATTSASDQQAIAWLGERLKPDDSVPRVEFKAECMEKFNVSERQYITHIWPDARKLAGLPRFGRPGPKRKSQN
jgi:hypothetical protein